MVYTFCIPGCKTGYRSAKNKTKIGTFSFPANEEQKQKWIAAIPCKGWQVTKNCSIFYFIQNSDDINDAPQLLGSVFVSHSLNVTALMSSTKISLAVYKHFLNDCNIKSFAGLSNILAFCKSTFLKEYTQKSCYLDMAIDALKHFESISSLNDSEEKATDSNLIQFIVERLELLQKAKCDGRYSVNLLTLSFLWQLSRTSLYKKLSDL